MRKLLNLNDLLLTADRRLFQKVCLFDHCIHRLLPDVRANLADIRSFYLVHAPLLLGMTLSTVACLILYEVLFSVVVVSVYYVLFICYFDFFTYADVMC